MRYDDAIVWTFLLTLRPRVLFDNAKWAYLGGFTEEEQKIRRQKTASWLREQILQLGPTFIKFGQFSSTRSDILPREFVDELAKLQDRVPALSPEKARAFIQSELGSPVDVLFKEFEDRPIAAASLGQVHRAILHNGEKVAVKVQRPGLENLFDIDLRNLKLVAEYFQRSETFGGSKTDWIGIYDECSKLLSSPTCPVLEALGKKLSFEIAIGLNGRVWVNASSPTTIIIVSNAIMNTVFLSGTQQRIMVEKLMQKLQ